MSKTFLSIGEAMIEISDGGRASTLRIGYAGDTLNTAWYARALLGESWDVSYLTGLGTDRYSDAMKSFLYDADIGTSRIVTIENRRPGLYLIHQENGDRHFTYWRDTSAAKLIARDEKRLGASVDGCEHIYFSGITLAILDAEDRKRFLNALRVQRARGATISFDPNIRPQLWSGDDEIRHNLTTAGAHADIVFPTFLDEQNYFGDQTPSETADRYFNLGATEVAVKNGADPVLIRAKDEEVTIRAVMVDDVVDPTGAGDSFNGAYLAARMSGIDIQNAAKLAHRVASICIRHHGALVPFEHIRPAAQILHI